VIKICHAYKGWKRAGKKRRTAEKCCGWDIDGVTREHTPLSKPLLMISTPRRTLAYQLATEFRLWKTFKASCNESKTIEMKEKKSSHITGKTWSGGMYIKKLAFFYGPLCCCCLKIHFSACRNTRCVTQSKMAAIGRMFFTPKRIHIQDLFMNFFSFHLSYHFRPVNVFSFSVPP
jgi:hypothetical protein